MCLSNIFIAEKGSGEPLVAEVSEVTADGNRVTVLPVAATAVESDEEVDAGQKAIGVPGDSGFPFHSDAITATNP